MLVRFIKNCGVYQAGMLLDMPENVAMLYVKRGVAEYVQKMREAVLPVDEREEQRPRGTRRRHRI